MSPVAPDRVWYASYGSNLSRQRFLHYVRGGRPVDTARVYPGARDASLPAAERALTVPGGILFGLESRVWGGGMAFYDADAPGQTLMRAYLVTVQQLSDIVAQEMHREVGADLDLAAVLEHGRVVLGPGRYETLHLVGTHDGAPVVTFTSSDPGSIVPSPPRPAYLRMIARGLREAHLLDDDELVAYLLARPGVHGAWDETRLTALLAEPADVVPS